MNKAILIGRLTKDNELATTQSGVSVLRFTLAVNRRFKNADGGYDADFINCVAWRQTAEFIAKHFRKGDMLGICGSIQTRNYEKDGRKVYVTEVIAEEAYFVGSKKGSSTGDDTNSIFDAPDIPAPDDDDLPF